MRFEQIEALIRREAHGTSFGRDFEWLCKWYLENAPLYRGQFRKVWRWDEWPDRWGRDCGIDLVAETTDGELWAVQCKAVSPEHTVTKAEIDSFLSESNRKQIAYRLLIATTDNIGANALRTIENQARHASVVLRGDLVTAELDWPSTIGGTAPKPPRWKPLPHQQAAIKDAVAGFKKHDRGRLIMACGTGKTLTGLWINEALGSRRTLLLVPSISLAQQNLKEWGRHAKEDFDCLVVCSDETVASDRDDPALRYVADLGIKPTTDPGEIAAFLAKRRSRPTLVISTYQSCERVSRGQAKAKKWFDLAICDEAHRLVGHAESQFATVLHDKKIRARRRLFMTATPRYFTQRAKERGAEQEIELVSMDDETKFGPEFHVLNFHDAITAKPEPLLTDYQVVVIGVTSAEAKAWVADAKLVRTRDGLETDARTLAAQIGLAKAVKQYDLTRMITFHRSIRRASRFVDGERRDSLPAVIEKLRPSNRPSGRLWARHVSGETAASKRASLLKELGDLPKGTRGVISNCACLGEGVDVPALDGVAFIDPKGSIVDIIQAVGRVIRKSPNKKIGTIIIPVFVDESEDADHALENSAFDPVWQVLKALRAHDRRLADELDALRTSLGKQTGGGKRIKLPANIVLDVPRLLLKDFEQAFYSRVVERVSLRTFDWWADTCAAWCRQHGRALSEMIIRTEHKGHAVGRWVSHQRSLHGKRLLSPEQVGTLESLGMVWRKKQPPDETWSSWLAVCRHWCRKRGSLATATQNTVFEGKELGRWMMKQRGRYRSGKLARERIDLLESMKIIWEPHDSRFERGLIACDKWLAQGKTLLNCGRGTIIDGFRFAKWIAVQRRLYREGQLSKERIVALEKRGMEWDPTAVKKAGWHQVLRRYVREHKTLAHVSQNEVFDGHPIGRYLNQRRGFYRRGKLEAKEIDALNAMGLVWNPLKAERDKVISLLAEWKKKHGGFDTLTNKTTFRGCSIGAALARWRTAYRQGVINPYVRQQLKKLGVEMRARYDWRETRGIARRRK